MMAKESNPRGHEPAPFDRLMAGLPESSLRAPPPVHLWDPPFCGDIDLRIARDGTWFYAGTPIGRPALVRLFASVLRKDEDRYVLVTPVEKVGIVVEDAPFLAVEMARRETLILLRTNVDDWVEVGAVHPMRFEAGVAGGLKPYVQVRGGLWALVHRPVFYDLMEAGVTVERDGVPTFGIGSGQAFFPIMTAAELERLAELPLE